MKKINWTLIILVLIGYVIGGFISTQFGILDYHNDFGLSSPVSLDLGFIVITFALQIRLSLASVIGVIIAFVVYRFIR